MLIVLLERKQQYLTTISAQHIVFADLPYLLIHQMVHLSFVSMKMAQVRSW